MRPTFARFASTPIGSALAATDDGLTIVTTVAGRHTIARSDIAAAHTHQGVEFTFWGDGALTAEVGVITADAALNRPLRLAGLAWALQQRVIIGSGGETMPIVQHGDVVGIRVTLDGGRAYISWYCNAVRVYRSSIDIGSSALHFAVSMFSDPGQLHCVVNSGQWQGSTAALQDGGWRAADIVVDPVRIATDDYMTAPTDVPPNTRYTGNISDDGFDVIASVSYWPWDSTSRSGTARITVSDADGALDALALSGAQSVPIAVRRVTAGREAATSEPIGRYTLERITIEDDGNKSLILADAHDALDNTLHRAVYLPSISSALAWQPQPVVIGAVRSVPGTSVNSDGSLQWLSDSSLASVSAVWDRGAQIDAYHVSASRQQMVLASPPVEPIVADVSSIGPDMQPATLTQMLADILDRAGDASWAASDARTIDATTGYAGIGYYAAAATSARTALVDVLPSYTADWWIDRNGVLRISRLVDPDTAATIDIDLDWRDLSADLIVMPDAAPNLSRRMSFQPNAHVLSDSDLVTDQIALPPAMRRQFTSPARSQVYGSGPLHARYAHADYAAPMPSRFDRRADAQAELDRVLALYAVARNFYTAQLDALPDFLCWPGQIVRLTYPRYGLQSGRRLLVVGVVSNHVTGSHTLRLWGA